MNRKDQKCNKSYNSRKSKVKIGLIDSIYFHSAFAPHHRQDSFSFSKAIAIGTSHTDFFQKQDL
jgi:hypothetical protein